jgi:hypothetical protein
VRVAFVCCRVVSAEKDADGIGEVRRDTVKVIVGAEEPQHDPEMAKPGARLQRLKEELQQQITQRRCEEWSRRLQEQRLDNEEEGEWTTLCISFVKCGVCFVCAKLQTGIWNCDMPQTLKICAMRPRATLQIVPVLSQIGPVHVLGSYFKINFNIFLCSTCRSFTWHLSFTFLHQISI